MSKDLLSQPEIKTNQWSLPELPLDANDPVFGIKDTERQVGLKKSAIYRMVSEGTFPPPINLGGKNGWLLSQLNLWIRTRIAASQENTSTEHKQGAA